jgi:hypothetical protein
MHCQNTACPLCASYKSLHLVRRVMVAGNDMISQLISDTVSNDVRLPNSSGTSDGIVVSAGELTRPFRLKHDADHHSSTTE